MSSQRRSKLQEKKLDAVVSEKGSDTTFKETPQTTSDGTGRGHDSGVSAAATMQPPACMSEGSAKSTAEGEGDLVSAPHLETQTDLSGEPSERQSSTVVVEKRCLECGEVCLQRKR